LSRRTHFILDLSAILFYCITIFVLSASRLEGPSFYPFPGFDKLVHMGLYAGLAMLVCRFLANHLRRSAPAAMIVAATLASLYGLSDEIHQSFVPTRSATVSDFIANTVGAVAAVAVWYFLVRRREKPSLLLMTEPPREKSADDLQV
jgi:VanZ family protein